MGRGVDRAAAAARFGGAVPRPGSALPSQPPAWPADLRPRPTLRAGAGDHPRDRPLSHLNGDGHEREAGGRPGAPLGRGSVCAWDGAVPDRPVRRPHVVADAPPAFDVGKNCASNGTTSDSSEPDAARSTAPPPGGDPPESDQISGRAGTWRRGVPLRHPYCKHVWRIMRRGLPLLSSKADGVTLRDRRGDLSDDRPCQANDVYGRDPE